MSKDLYYINDNDAFLKYGVILDYESLGNLMAPPPLKDYVENDNPNEDGVSIASIFPKIDKRSLTLIFHLYADTQAEALERYNDFCTMLTTAPFKLYVVRTGITYNLIYKSSTSFVPWFDGIAKYTLSVVEPSPTVSS